MDGEGSLKPAEQEIGAQEMAVTVGSARVNIRRLTVLLLTTLLPPLLLGITIDIGFGTAPMATIVLGFLAIPLSTILVMRATLAEFSGIIHQVAPETQPEQDEETDPLV